VEPTFADRLEGDKWIALQQQQVKGDPTNAISFDSIRRHPCGAFLMCVYKSL
jgi:hypothetical protein